MLVRVWQSAGRKPVRCQGRGGLEEEKEEVEVEEEQEGGTVSAPYTTEARGGGAGDDLIKV